MIRTYELPHTTWSFEATRFNSLKSLNYKIIFLYFIIKRYIFFQIRLWPIVNSISHNGGPPRQIVQRSNQALIAKPI